MELGENTAQVMYGQGELFVDGIVAGLESQAAELESTANALAEAFTTSFEEVLIAGIERAIAAAEAALARMPQVPDMDFDFGTRDDDGNNEIRQISDAVTQGMIKRSEAIDPELYKNIKAPALTARLGGVSTSADRLSPAPRGIPAPGTGIFAGIGTTNINIRTGADPGPTVNAVRRYVNTNTLSGVLSASNTRDLGG
jgi:hypothetical protein